MGHVVDQTINHFQVVNLVIAHAELVVVLFLTNVRLAMSDIFKMDNVSAAVLWERLPMSSIMFASPALLRVKLARGHNQINVHHVLAVYSFMAMYVL